MSCNHDTGYATTPAQPDEVGWVLMPFEVDICGDIIPAGDLIAYARRLRTNLSEAERSLKELATTKPAPRTPQPQPAAVVLPTVDEAARVIPEAWANPSSVGSVHLIAAQAVLDLIAARLPVWQPVEPGAVIKAGTVTRIEWDDRDAREEVTRADYTPCQTDPARFYVDPRTVPAEPEDPRVAVVLDWYLSSEAPGTDADLARDLLARLDAVRADA